MKKQFLLLLFCLPFLGQAQNIKGPYIGVHTQFQNTWIINDEQYENVNYRHNFTTKWAPIGFTLGYKFNENHNVQVEGAYSRQGEKLDLVDQDGKTTGEKEIELTYYTIPLLFKYTTPGTFRFTFQVGPQLSILQEGREVNRFFRPATYIRDKESITIPQGTYVMGSTEESERNNSATETGDFNKYDLGVLLGIGAEYSFTDKLFLTANLRYNYNFVNIRDNEYLRPKYDPDYYVLRQNMVVGIQVGLNFLFNTGDGSSNARHQ